MIRNLILIAILQVMAIEPTNCHDVCEKSGGMVNAVILKQCKAAMGQAKRDPATACGCNKGRTLCVNLNLHPTSARQYGQWHIDIQLVHQT